MNWTHLLAACWLDFFAGATVLLVLTWIASRVIRQPVQRLAIAWSSMAAILVLMVCCVVPGWPRMALFEQTRPGTLQPVNAWTASVDTNSSAQPRLPSLPKLNKNAQLHKKARTPDDADVRLVPDRNPSPQGLETSATLGVDLFVLGWWTITLGSLLVLAWLLSGQFRAWQLCRRASDAPASHYAELRTIAGSSVRCPRLLVSPSLSTAVATGTWRPTILLPPQFGGESISAPGDCQDSDDQSLRALLAHEWSHIERGDLWLLAIGRVLLVLLFANPAYWLLWRRIRTDQELLADSAAAALLGRHTYAEMLVSWARIQRPVLRIGWSLGASENPSQLSRRIAMLMDERIQHQMSCSRVWRIAAMAGTLALVACLSLVTLNPTHRAAAQSAANAEGPAVRVASGEGALAKNDSLEAKVTIRGTCRDEKHKPISHARVMLFRIDHSKKYCLRPRGRMRWVTSTLAAEHTKNEIPPQFQGGWGDPDRQRLVQEARTDADGNFELAEIAADEGWVSGTDNVRIVAQAAGRGTEFQGVNIINQGNGRLYIEKLTITLPEATSIRGRITNTNGSPVEGAVVNCADVNCLAKPLPGIVTAVTDADGRYEISDLSHFDVDDSVPMVTPFGALGQASAILSVEHADYAPGFVEYTRTPATIDHVLQRPAVLRGRVVFDENEHAAPKTWVRWTYEDGWSSAVPTADDGHYVIPRLWPGKVTVTAERLDKDRLPVSQEIVLAAGENRLDLRLKVGAFIKGRCVVDATGEVPKTEASTFFASLSVNVQLPSRGPSDPSQNIQANMENGSFSLTVEPGHHLINIWNDQWQLVDVERWAKKGIEVALGQTAEIELRLAPRQGGWNSLMSEVRATQAEAKGEPVPPIPALVEGTDESSWSESGEEDLVEKAIMDWPTELLPKKPMSEQAMVTMLEGLAEVERKTIEGEEQITAISFGECFDGNPDETGPLLFLEYSVLANIRRLPHLESLMVLGAPGDDSWLEPLHGHQALQRLTLAYSKKITSIGIRHLASLPNLKELCAVGRTLNDDALREIDAFPKLESLQFGGMVTDAGIAHLEGNSKLKTLYVMELTGSNLTDESLRYAASMPNLAQLSFVTTSPGSLLDFSDAGLKHLAGHSRLSELEIYNARITDDGLAHLKGLKNLKKVTLQNTLVTPEGVKTLKAHLPKLEVVTRDSAAVAH